MTIYTTLFTAAAVATQLALMLVFAAVSHDKPSQRFDAWSSLALFCGVVGVSGMAVFQAYGARGALWVIVAYTVANIGAFLLWLRAAILADEKGQ